jgi:diguanylate cyclase (GGDEF)-like protein/PAS domain S-box-containing protein
VSDATERIQGERALRTLTAIFDATTDIVLQTDPHGQLLYANPAARRLLGLAAEEPIGHLNALAFNPPETVARHAVEIVPAALEKGLWAGETLQWDAQRRELLVSHLLIAHRDRHGKLEYFSAILRDITAQRAAQQALHRSEAVLRSVADVVPMAIAVFDRSLRCLLVNQTFEAKLRRPRDFLLGREAEEVLGIEEFEIRRPWIERALAGERVSFERDHPERDQHRHVQVEHIPLFDAAGEVEGFVSVTADVSATRAEERRLRDLAQTDPLTGLLNRTGFEQVLDDRAASAKEGADEAGLVAVLYIDLDRFKPINDAHGHAIGDTLLQAFAARLRTLVRPTDTIARLGGDEFVIVLRLSGAAHAAQVARKVIEAVSQPYALEGRDARITISAGVGLYPTHGENAETLMKSADLALYEAKRSGKNLYRIAAP